MSFSDEDLKRLKEELTPYDPRIVTPLENAYPKFRALLARLEAAEVIAEIYAADWPNSGLVKTWREACKAAGK